MTNLLTFVLVGMFDAVMQLWIMLECHSYCSIVLDMDTVVGIDYNNILLMDDSKMLVDHHMHTSMVGNWNRYLMDYNNNYSHRVIEEKEYNNMEMDDKMDNTWRNDGTVALDTLECLLAVLLVLTSYLSDGERENNIHQVLF